jgi:hypothetical protein
MNSILIFYIKSSGGRRISPDRGVPPLVFREGWAIGDGPTSKKVYAAWASAIYLIITSRLFFPNRRAQDFVLKDGGVNPRKLDQRFELGSNEAIKSLVIGGLEVGFFSCWDIQKEIAMGLVRQINIPGLRIQRIFSWALPSGELGGLPGEFYQFANSIRSELSAVSVSPLKEAA